MRRTSLMLFASGCLVFFAGTAAAVEPSDFGIPDLQRAKVNYVAGDPVAARRNVVEATGVLSSLAEGMGAPGRGEVWMLVNDLRLLRLPAGDADPATLHRLADAEIRATALAVRYPDGSGRPATLQ